MKLPAGVRSSLVFVVALGLLLSLLLLVFPHEEEPRSPAAFTREEIPPVPEASDGVPGELALIGPGSGSRFSRYETAVFRGKDGKEIPVDYLAYHLTTVESAPRELSATAVELRIFPRPATLEEARARRETEMAPSVTLRAGEARMEKAEQWVLHLSKGVQILSRDEEGTSTLDTDELTVWTAERRIAGDAPVSLVARQYQIEGRGLRGRADLGTFSVERDVTVRFPTAVLLAAADAPGAETLVRCDGPLFVQRTGPADEMGYVPAEVTFENAVRVSGEDGSGELSAGRVVLVLGALSQAEEDSAVKEDPGLPPVRVDRLDAMDDVLLTRKDGSRLTAPAITILTEEDHHRIDLAGPSVFVHRGPMALGPSGEDAAEPAEGAPPEELVLTSNGPGTVLSHSDGDLTAHFEASRLERRRVDGETLLRVSGDSLSVESEVEHDVFELRATGHAAFSLPPSEIDGDAADLVYTRRSGDETEIRLVGNPRIESRGTGRFDPSGLDVAFTAREKPGETKTNATETTAITRLAAEDSMTLVTREQNRSFRMRKEASVRRLEDGIETFLLEAADISAELTGDVPRTLNSTGGVSFVARPETDKPGERGLVTATGTAFAWDEAGGKGLLTGAPALVRIREHEDAFHQLAAPRITFATGGEGVVADGGQVDGIVQLRGEGKAPTPVELSCRSLLIVPEVESEEEAEAENASPGGASAASPASELGNRLRLLRAEGGVILRSEGWTGTGDLLVFDTVKGRTLSLTGKPAHLFRRHPTSKGELTDTYESPGFTLGLSDREIVSFLSPDGASFVLHRPWQEGEPRIFGDGDGKKGRGPGAGEPSLERFSGSSRGPVRYDKGRGTVSMEREAIVEQSVGDENGFRKVANFAADVIEARLAPGPDGADQLVRVEGRGRVRGTGVDWQVDCDYFEVDFLAHRTTVRGDPARVTVDGQVHTVGQAVYDYEKDAWKFAFIRIR